MRLSLHTDYALRLLMFLAVKQQQASIDEIAKAYGISRNHLMKVGQRLTELGYVTARRGRGGGLTLSHSPESINVGALVRQVESTRAFVECFDPETNQCRVTGGCGLQAALSLALGDFMVRLDKYSLADLVPVPKKFLDRLSAVSLYPVSGAINDDG
ncbi:Rrf2 family transcriptional regulator [Sphingorhabdus sp. IMCC26285]|uniref:Rrf2 family transcriptional regulator n=1 Tax=Sphingorhabdus profundilacus TaxID=2509718 RepID=A0A6I4LX20_9SPHN|nr:Rrf2 family transcriptional regulator [Sphingorhabdus profundilacus]MVZ98087.1 Rrf2 family transcriptional regulator [Sphingorhabdus profundilacus]